MLYLCEQRKTYLDLLNHKEIPMKRESRANLAVGILLILIGGWFLAIQFFPALKGVINLEQGWPLIVVGAGVFLLILGLLTRVPGLAVPACIVGGIGGILYWQFLTQKWESWTYAWALIPGFVGVGVIIARLLGDNDQGAYRAGLKLILISFILFVVFFLFLGGQGILREYWPILVILLGIWIFAQALLRRK
jgi:hypothetical protein